MSMRLKNNCAPIHCIPLPIKLRQAKLQFHPGVEVGERDVAAADSFGLASRAGGEGQRANVVRADVDARVGGRLLLQRAQSA